jgi:hypothetical protein
MPLQLLRKPPIGNTRSDRLKITFAGNHTVKQKIAMMTEVKFWLQHEQGIGNVGPSDLYLSLIDPNGYPLTSFRDGRAVCDYNLVIESPYHCAADDYDRRHHLPGPCPF